MSTEQVDRIIQLLEDIRWILATGFMGLGSLMLLFT